MAASEELGIKKVHSLHFATTNPKRSHQYYTKQMGWNVIAASSSETEERHGQSSVVYGNGAVRWVVSTPLNEQCRAGRFLKRHPSGVMSVSFEVEDIERAWSFLEERGATPVHGIRESTNNEGGYFKHFSIVTPIGDVTFRFLQKSNWAQFAPGIDYVEASANDMDPFQINKIDHITCNVLTMAPVKLWFEHVLGMEQCWSIRFHTDDLGNQSDHGTGLKSVVMWDPASGIKIPINEPLEPYFKEGQINQFVEDNAGGGVQHVAIEVDHILSAAETLTNRGVQFLDTPDVYYDPTPRRLEEVGVDVKAIDHSLEQLKEYGLLIDGSPTNNYMLQVFFKEASAFHEDEKAGPFFFEIIERQGDQGFGGGNFRALFEAIERSQTQEVAA
jgi:4-hydroxyphenylpyruvate dioxygenase